MSAAKLAGVVVLKAPSGIACPIEVHVETATHWEGYNRANSFGGYQRYPKARYVVVEDRRA